MHEVITLQIGQCGNTVGQKFWEILCEEHNIDYAGKFFGNNFELVDKVNVFFDEACFESKYTPRVVCFDYDPIGVEKLQNSACGNLFNYKKIVFGIGGTGNNYAKGLMDIGFGHFENLLETIRREVETCDRFEGFQLLTSLGGGTGSSISSNLLGTIENEYNRPISSYSIFPSEKVSTVVLEPYNMILSFRNFLTFVNQVFCMDNDALYNICLRKLQCPTVNYNDLNKVISQTMSGITAAMRLNGPNLMSYRKLLVNLNTKQHLKLYLPGFISLQIQKPVHKQPQPQANDFLTQMINPNNFIATVNPEGGKYFAFGTFFRGDISQKLVDDTSAKFYEKQKKIFATDISNPTFTSLSYIPPNGFSTFASFAAPTSAINHMIRRVFNQFTAMYKNKSYIHLYQSTGFDEREFEIAKEFIEEYISTVESYSHQSMD